MSAIPKIEVKSEPGKPFKPLQPANDNVQATTKPNRYPGMVSSREFVRGFKPPDYHVDGISQKGYLYSTTAMTGTGKTAVLLLIAALTMLERFSVDVNRNSKGVPKSAQIRFGLL